MSLTHVDRPRQGLEPPRDKSWFEHAACRDADRQLFFEPDGEAGKGRASRIQAAKAVCAGCPVRRECLLFALAAPEHYGIWGGFTARERAALKRRRPVRPARSGGAIGAVHRHYRTARAKAAEMTRPVPPTGSYLVLDAEGSRGFSRP